MIQGSTVHSPQGSIVIVLYLSRTVVKFILGNCAADILSNPHAVNFLGKKRISENVKPGWDKQLQCQNATETRKSLS